MKSQQRKQKQEEKVDLGLCIYEMPVVRFEADILAAQDFDRIYRSRPLSPERELMVAVLEEALADYQHCWKARDTKGRKRFADARAWILSTDSEWIFSFINCCETLGIAPAYLRRGLLSWRRAKIARRQILSVPLRRESRSRLDQAAA